MDFETMVVVIHCNIIHLVLGLKQVSTGEFVKVRGYSYVCMLY